MPLYPDPLHGNIRYRVAAFAAVAAGAITPNVMVTPDDAKARLVTGILATPQGLGIRYRVTRAGYAAAEYDGSVIAAAAGFVPLDLLFEQGIQIEIDVNNTSGGPSVAAAVVVRYELLRDPTPA